MTRTETARRQLTREQVVRSCDAAWFHLLSAGLVGPDSDDLVTATLRQIASDSLDRAAA